jgi:fatty acid desaturase
MMPSSIKNTLALVYVFAAYLIDIALLLSSSWMAQLLGTVLLTHALLTSALLTHELMHGTLFKQRSLNVFWGQVMTHLNGAYYAPWEALEQHHFNHHVHHADFVPFDLAEWVNTLSPMQRRLFLALEWAYFPALELMLRIRSIVLSLQDPATRWRTGLLLAYRAGLFAALGYFSGVAVLLYGIAYISFVNLMRFADAFSHTYDYAIVSQPFPKHDRAYEQAHTLSNLTSVNYPLLNLIFLNFGYHAAHHYDMRCPWHELPQLHERLFGSSGGNIVPLPQLVGNYHRFRLTRLSSGQGEVNVDQLANQAAMLQAFTGAVGVSFLTPP